MEACIRVLPGSSQEKSERRFEIWREQLLRTEIRDLRATVIRINQWAVTVLASIQTALYFIRRDVIEHMGPHDASTSSIPFSLYLRGTVFLFMIATAFTFVSARAATRLKGYRLELKKYSISGIEEKDIDVLWTRFANLAIFYSFPLFDIILRAFPKFEITFK